MKMKLLYLICLLTLASLRGQNPQITGDTMLCPWTNGTAVVTNQNFDSYQWYSKYWFTADPYIAIDGATGPSFTYDWYTYDQALFKVIATKDGVTYESNVIQIDSYAWVGLSYSTTYNENVTFDWDTGNYSICEGGEITVSLESPYNASIRWFRDGDPIQDAIQTSYVITAPGTYYVEAAPDFCPNSISSTSGIPVTVVANPQCNLGINVPSSSSMSLAVYPNPVSNLLFATIGGGGSIKSYTIIDAAGKQLAHSVANGNEAVLQIDTSALTQGFYLLEVTSDHGKAVKKFIKN